MLPTQADNTLPRNSPEAQGGQLIHHRNTLIKVWRWRHNNINLGYLTKDILMTIKWLSFKAGENIYTLTLSSNVDICKNS